MSVGRVAVVKPVPEAAVGPSKPYRGYRLARPLRPSHLGRYQRLKIRLETGKLDKMEEWPDIAGGSAGFDDVLLEFENTRHHTTITERHREDKVFL